VEWQGFNPKYIIGPLGIIGIMNIGIIGDCAGWHARQFALAATKRGHTAQMIDFRELASNLPERGGVSWGDPKNAPAPFHPDAILIRTMPAGTLEQVIFRMNLLGIAHTRGICLVNPPRSLEVCIDKYLTTTLCQNAGIAVPRTIVFQTAIQALEGLAILGGDGVVKPLFGSEGRGIVRVSDPDTAWRVFSAIERMGQVIYLQEFVQHPGWDLRVMVLDGRIVGGMKRDGNGHWRTNVAQGGSAEACPVPDIAAQMALDAARVTGVVFGGIDLILDVNGNWKLIEVNGVPGFRAFSRATGIDVANLVIQQVEEKHTCPNLAL